MMRHILVLSLIAACFLGTGIGDCKADWLELGGTRVELVDGNVTDATANDVLVYSRNLYDRGDYHQAEKYLAKLIEKYNGTELADAHFLQGKANFMAGSSDSNPERIEWSYDSFLMLFDGFRSSSVVVDGRLQETLFKAIERLIRLARLSVDECCDSIDFRFVDHLVMFYELWKYVSGNESLDKAETVLSTRYKKEFTLTRDILIDVGQTGFNHSPEKCYQMYLGGNPTHSDTPDLIFLILWSNLLLEEWEYMRLNYAKEICFSPLYAMRQPILALSRNNLMVDLNGQAVDAYVGIWRKIRAAYEADGKVSFTIELHSGDRRFQFDVEGPRNWSWSDLGIAGGKHHTNVVYIRLDWDEESFAGPIATEFVLRDLVYVRHGSEGNWVGLRAKEDNL